MLSLRLLWITPIIVATARPSRGTWPGDERKIGSNCHVKQDNAQRSQGFGFLKKERILTQFKNNPKKSRFTASIFASKSETFFKDFHPMCKMWNLIIPFICNSILLFRFSVIRNSSSSQGWIRMKLTTILIFVVLMTSLILACRHDDVYLKFYHPTDLKPMNPISAVIFSLKFLCNSASFLFFTEWWLWRGYPQEKSMICLITKRTKKVE